MVCEKICLGLLVVLIALGLGIIFFQALPYLRNKHHEELTLTHTFYAEEIQTFIYLKLETTDAFTANNPINVTIQTGILPPETSVQGIQLTFDGADEYFPGDFNLSDPSFFEEQYETFHQKLTSNAVRLKKDTAPVTGITKFSGNVPNLTYLIGGTFDIGITIFRDDGSVVGYGMGNKSYAIDEVIHISPPEVLLTIKNNNLMAGLAWVGIALAFLALALGLISLIKR